MAKILGIIGGGQLGMMIVEAAKKMPQHISKIIVLDPIKNCPASQVGAEQIVADFKDKNAIIELAKKSDIITYEIESGDSDVLKLVETDAEINPSPETLKIIQDKFLQKSFLLQNNIAVPEFIKVESILDLETGLKKFGYPSLLKARSKIACLAADNKLKPGEVWRQESILGSVFDASFRIHENNILRQTIAPARVSEKTAKKADEIAKTIMSVLKGAGIFGIEMFVTKNDEIVINEIAPRVHNSGHHTLQSSETSQFEQHLRAILGLELGGTSLLHPTIMYNILGPKNFEGEYKTIEITEQNVFLKMYGKKISKPLRKLGHFNLVGKNYETVDQLLKKIEELKDKVSINPA